MDIWLIVLHVLIMLGAAMALGTVAIHIRQHPVVGYIIAGLLIGPNVLGIVDTREEMLVIADLGVALLLFTIGLEFSAKKLISLGPVTYLAAPLQVIFTGVAGFGVAVVFGVSMQGAFVVGAAVAISSTACVLGVLSDRMYIDSPFGRNAIGILLFQDIAVVPIILILSLMGNSEAGNGRFLDSVLLIAVGIAALYFFLNYAAPFMFKLRKWAVYRDMPILLATTTALGSAWVTHHLGMGPALGAFLAGLLLAESPFAKQIKSDVFPMKSLLITLFFASVGMFGNPAFLASNWHVVTVIVVALLVFKPLLVWLPLRLIRQPGRISLATGVSLSQAGEFSFVIIASAMAMGTIDIYIFRLFVSVTIITLILTPYCISLASFICSMKKGLSEKDKKASHQDNLSVIIIGFGPAGQRVAESLSPIFTGKVSVIDLNHKNAGFADKLGAEFHVGDAGSGDLLRAAGISFSRLVVVTIPDWDSTLRIIGIVSELAPECKIIARARNQRSLNGLYSVGADIVIDEENAAGLKLAEESIKIVSSLS